MNIINIFETRHSQLPFVYRQCITSRYIV